MDTLDFDLNKTQIDSLVGAGKRGAHDYLARNSLVSQRNSTDSSSSSEYRLSFGLLTRLIPILKLHECPDLTASFNQDVLDGIRRAVDHDSTAEIARVIDEFYVNGERREIEYLNSIGLNFCAQDRNGNTALHLAAYRGDRQSIQSILNDYETIQKKNKNDLQIIKNNENQTYIFYLLNSN